MEIGHDRGGVNNCWLGVMIAFCVLVTSPAIAMDVAFHGYLEANLILRDSNGFQQGFYDNIDMIQQKNTLKFDVDAYFKEPLGAFIFDKVHLTYRGSWDTIFNTSNDYDAIPDSRGGRFDYGKDDIRYESDLREAFLDLTYEGSAGTGFFRPGRQLVSWGEVTGFNIIDIINPPDGSSTMSAFPDELKIPLWMGRINYSLPPQPAFNLNFDLLAIPDIRPAQLAPVEKSGQAPYIRNTPIGMIGQLSGISEMLGMPWIWEGVHEDVPTDEMAFAARTTADIGANSSVSLYFLRTANPNPAPRLSKTLDMSPLIGAQLVGAGLTPGTPAFNAAYSNAMSQLPLPNMPQSVAFEHDFTNTYGASFNSYIEPVDIVLKGEVGYTTDVNYMRNLSSAIEVPAKYSGSYNLGPIGQIPYGPDYEMFSKLDTWSCMLGFDKKIWARWFSDAMINLGFQYIHSEIEDMDNEEDFVQAVSEKTDIVSFMAAWNWFNGKIEPSIFVMYDFNDTYMTDIAIKYTVTPHLYVKLDQLAFLGDDEARGTFGALIGGQTYDANSQLLLVVGYQW